MQRTNNLFLYPHKNIANDIGYASCVREAKYYLLKFYTETNTHLCEDSWPELFGFLILYSNLGFKKKLSQVSV